MRKSLVILLTATSLFGQKLSELPVATPNTNVIIAIVELGDTNVTTKLTPSATNLSQIVGQAILTREALNSQAKFEGALFPLPAGGVARTVINLQTTVTGELLSSVDTTGTNAQPSGIFTTTNGPNLVLPDADGSHHMAISTFPTVTTNGNLIGFPFPPPDGSLLKVVVVGTNIYLTNAVAGVDFAPRTATFVIAASNSPASYRENADFVCDGTDDDVEWQAAIDGLPIEGGLIVPAPGVYYISETLQIGDGSSTNRSNRRGIAINSGMGLGNVTSEMSTTTAGVRLQWTGGAGETMMQINGPVSGLLFNGFMLDCNDLGGIGLDAHHPFNSWFSNITINRNTDWAINLDAYFDPPSGVVEAASENVWININAKRPGTGGNGMTIGVPDFSGVVPLDVARNVFTQCTFYRSAGTNQISLRLQYMDSCAFYSCYFNGLGGTSEGDALRVVGVTNRTVRPSNVVFYNTPLLGEVTVEGTWDGTAGLLFLPLPVGDVTNVPPSSVTKMFGLTDAKGIFGYWGWRDDLTVGNGSSNVFRMRSNLSGANDPILTWENNFIGSSHAFIADGAITAGTDDTLGWVARSKMYTEVDGEIIMANAALADFTGLIFGTRTTNHTGIFLSGTNLYVRLGNNGDFAGLVASRLTSADLEVTNSATIRGLRVTNNMTLGDGSAASFAINSDLSGADSTLTIGATQITSSTAFTATTSLGAGTASSVGFTGGSRWLQPDNGSMALNNSSLVVTNTALRFGVHAFPAAAKTLASAATIAPLDPLTFISGTTTIDTITPPARISSTGGTLTLVPTDVWSTSTSGNIALATTAVANKALTLFYDPTTTKWYPSY